MSDQRLQFVEDMIDRANSKDPNQILDNHAMRPAEQVYGERMTRMLKQFCSLPSEHLQISARAQHIERWTSSRENYPAGRAGYLKWRRELKQYHARRTAELMQEAGYRQPDMDRVTALIQKQDLKRDLETQMLEDTACLVFLKYYAGDFIAKHDELKIIDILQKTARKMSKSGLSAAGKLDLPDRLSHLLAKALAAHGQG